ncbi:MAG: Fic family protein [Methanobacteriota archaeon]
MIVYLSEEEIREINQFSLELTGEGEKFQVIQPDDIRFIIRFVSKNLEGDIYRKALGFCICLIVLHPFRNGNHRTSLLSAERFLQKNHCHSQAIDDDRIQLEKWRLQYENDHELHREFFRITNIEDETDKRNEIEKIMKSVYGTKIEKWLKRYNPNVS